MGTEIEAKLKVDSLEEIEQRLAQLGAQFLEEQVQKDCYLDDSASDLKNSDRALRLRCERTDKGQRTVLAYKGPKAKDNYKKRQEIEVEIKDIDSAERLFSELGYERVLVFEKRRRVWRFLDCVIALDELPRLGSFVEIEGPDDERIADVQGRLHLSSVRHIMDSYACLMEAELHRHGLKNKEIFL